MGICGSKADVSKSVVVTHEPPKASTQAIASPIVPQKKFCGTPGFDTNQRVDTPAVFFVDFDQTFAKAHLFKVSPVCTVFLNCFPCTIISYWLMDAPCILLRQL